MRRFWTDRRASAIGWLIILMGLYVSLKIDDWAYRVHSWWLTLLAP